MNNETTTATPEATTAATEAPVDLEQLRQEAMKREAENMSLSKPEQLREVDEMIAYLQANREHIAGLAITVVPFEGTVTILPGTGKVAHGLSTRCCINANYEAIALRRLQVLLDPKPSIPSFLGALLGR